MIQRMSHVCLSLLVREDSVYVPGEAEEGDTPENRRTRTSDLDVRRPFGAGGLSGPTSDVYGKLLGGRLWGKKALKLR